MKGPLGRLRREVGKRLARRRAEFLLVSYPKCGRTWVRMMLGRAIKIHFGIQDVPEYKLTRLHRAEPRSPAIESVHEGDPLRKRPDQLRVKPSRYASKGIILLVRDPRDVLVSAYFERKYRDPLRGMTAFEGGLPEFLHQPVGSIDTIIRYYNLWAVAIEAARSSMLVRYEDVREDPARELRRILSFVGLAAVSDEAVAEAVEFGSFENMRRLEESGEIQANVLRAGIRGNPDTYKTRDGRVGGFREHLPSEDIARLDEKIRSQLSPVFGYRP